MKFKTKTTTLTASVDDIALATLQGSITYASTVANNMSDAVFARTSKSSYRESDNIKGSIVFFAISLSVLFAGIVLFVVAFTNNRLGNRLRPYKEPFLVHNESMVSI